MCIYIYTYTYTCIYIYKYIIIWAIGKTSIEKCDLGSKLSFLGLHYIVLQHILIASCASPGKLRAESLFTPPLQCLKHLWLPCAFFCSAPTVWYGMIHVNATANLSCTKQVWIQLLEEVWMSAHSDMLHAFQSLPSVKSNGAPQICIAAKRSQ